MRRVAMVAIALFALLIGNLTWVQFVQNDFYANNERNTRVLLEEYSRQRGAILASSEPIATSVATEGELKYQREYANGPLYANLTGYKSLVYGASGIEGAENEVLSGADDRLFVDRITDTFTGREPAGGNVILSVNPKIQEAMSKGIGSAVGAAVAIDPKTGAILGQFTSPSFDPNPLADHDREAEQTAWKALNNDAARPLLDRSAADRYPPGSTFKVIVSAAALEMGMTPDTMVPAGNSYSPPDTTHNITNSNNQCAEAQLALKEALARSCNTTFSRLCVETIGPEKIAEVAARFGFEEGYQTPLAVTASTTGTLGDKATLAQSCIGQNEVAATPFQMAMVSAAIANGGTRMAPQLIKELQGPDQTTLERTTADELNESVTPEVASQLQVMMQQVVTGGTGTSAAIQGVTVGGKTGTAEHGDGAPEHGWFTGYAMGDDGKPAIAVAVFLESAGDGGSGKATEIAGAVMKVALGK